MFLSPGWWNLGCFPKRGTYFRIFWPKNVQIFKPSAPHLYPNTDRVTPRSLVIDGKNKVTGTDFLKWLIFSNNRFLMLSWRKMQCSLHHYQLLENLSIGVFERLTSTRSKVFSVKICLDATIVVFLSVFSFIETIYRNIWAKPLPKNPKGDKAKLTTRERPENWQFDKQ